MLPKNYKQLNQTQKATLLATIKHFIIYGEESALSALEEKIESENMTSNDFVSELASDVFKTYTLLANCLMIFVSNILT